MRDPYQYPQIHVDSVGDGVFANCTLTVPLVALSDAQLDDHIEGLTRAQSQIMVARAHALAEAARRAGEPFDALQ